MDKEVSLNSDDVLVVFFEGHEFRVKHDVRTNENLIMDRVI